MKLVYKNLKFFTEAGSKVVYNFNFKNFPFITKSLFKALFIKKKKIIKIYKGSCYCFMRQLTLYKDIFIYNGKSLKKIKVRSLFLYKKYGQLIFTRVLNSGKILHLTKKNLKK